MNIMHLACYYYYFLKKSGILIDCSFTLLVGVLGVSKDGVVPPTGRFAALVVPPPFVGAMPKSILGDAWEVCAGCTGLSYPWACVAAVCGTEETLGFSSLAFSLEALPPTL